jgi:hypothetical protein
VDDVVVVDEVEEAPVARGGHHGCCGSGGCREGEVDDGDRDRRGASGTEA